MNFDDLLKDPKGSPFKNPFSDDFKFKETADSFDNRFENGYGWLETEKDQSASAKPVGKALAQSDLSEDQLRAYDLIMAWVKRGGDLITLGGYAGTGKTTLVSMVSREMGEQRIAFCAYTGQASNNLSQKLQASGVFASYCGTIHRLIYRPIVNEATGAVESWEKVEELPYDLIVVDEASMVDEAMFGDLKSYGVPILAVGDHGQLPPVKGQFNMMLNPDVRLDHIHRQAEGDPIIRLSADIRKHGAVALYRSTIYPMMSVGQMFADYYKDPDRALATAMLCFTNKKRNSINASVRRSVFDNPSERLVARELVVCLKNTKFDCEYVFNGMRGKVIKSNAPIVDPLRQEGPKKFKARIEFPADRLLLEASVNASQFNREKTIASFADAGLPENSRWTDVGMLFDYGYCLTVHKAQGAEFADVAVVLENMSYIEEDVHRRWAYTAVTRASQRLYLVHP